MTDLGTDGTHNGRKGATWGSGYVPHSGMERFRCPKCGCTQFKSYPQTAPTNRSKTWTWEYVCVECGQGMGLTIKGED